MRFTTLLDPDDLVRKFVSDPGTQQRSAHALFPKLVRNSRLNYWRVGDPILSNCQRLLIGVGASFSLTDLQFLEMINNRLEHIGSSAIVDVFDIADLEDEFQIAKYYEQFQVLHTHPIVGVWHSGALSRVDEGYAGMKLVFHSLGISSDPQDVFRIAYQLFRRSGRV